MRSAPRESPKRGEGGVEFAPLDLAGVCARNGRRAVENDLRARIERHLAHHLGEAGAQLVTELVIFDVEANLLAMQVVREAQRDQPSLDLGQVGHDPPLDRQRAELVAITDDRLFDPSGDEERRPARGGLGPTGLLKEPLVARPQPAVCAERRCRRAFVAEVRQHRAVSADAQLAALIGGQRRPVGVDDLHLGARQRAPDAGQLSAVKQPPAFFLGQIGRKATSEVRVLGQPPTLQQAELGLFFEGARQARGQRR